MHQRGPHTRPSALSLAVLGIGFALVAAAITALGTGFSRTHSRPHALPSPSASASPPQHITPADTSNACGLPDTRQVLPTDAPRVIWTLYNGVAVPGSTADGPGRINGPVATCYAHTPTGALVAVRQIVTRLLAGDSADVLTILREQTMPGPGRDIDVARVQMAGSDSTTGMDGRFVGYRVVSYSPQTAVIDLAKSVYTDGTDYETGTYTLRWSHGDWRLQPQDDGGLAAGISKDGSLVGYTPWKSPCDSGGVMQTCPASNPNG